MDKNDNTHFLILLTEITIEIIFFCRYNLILPIRVNIQTGLHPDPTLFQFEFNLK